MLVLPVLVLIGILLLTRIGVEVNIRSLIYGLGGADGSQDLLKEHLLMEVLLQCGTVAYHLYLFHHESLILSDDVSIRRHTPYLLQTSGHFGNYYLHRFSTTLGPNSSYSFFEIHI